MEEHDFLTFGHIQSWDSWFKSAQQKWDGLKKSTTQFESLIDQYNYQQKLSAQQPSGVYKVVYNATGTHISSCVIDTHNSPPKVYEYPTQAFIVDYKTYYFETPNIDEAHYLCAILNAPSVDGEIKAHQPRGIYKGERGIERTPFEACAIPPFNPANADHMALARLSQAAHAIVKDTPLSGQVVKARGLAREAVADQIAAIDEIARRVLGL
jgi:hypothetical protein